MAPALVEHVVADAGAFLKKAPLQDIGRNIYTLRDVVEEIRDKPTRRSLAFLPYELTFKEPSPEHIRHVTEFSKKTGDYPSLSATDIKVLALTYQLQLEHVGSQNLKTEPELKVNVQTTRRHPETPLNVAGFHFPSNKPAESPNIKLTEARERDQFNSFQFWREPLPSIDQLLVLLGPEDVSKPDRQNQTSSQTSGDQFNSFQFWREPVPSIDEDLLGLLNVLIQIGLHVLSVNGMVIRQARNYILRCHACFKTTGNMNKVFCPHCGNKTLKKLAVTLNEDGSLQMHFSRNPKVLNSKGLRHSLPLPQGGKHANNPQLVEDQRFPQQRLSRKARQKTDVFDPDYVAGVSPFCQNDIYSRAANLHIRDGQSGGGRRRENPNATRRKFVKKK
ncbi:RNA-binding protein NOB1 isoform X2 [Amphiprion ocellaris]|uniref:RNA-binding protein NOB1 isoform X2 n=1 Tax=Amphiprion ocellaris TaxID=80972 RepID=UPI000C30AFFD|nr:RNA-binding protein NOB1 isoform X2 [Amphiprion ocellaris]